MDTKNTPNVTLSDLPLATATPTRSGKQVRWQIHTTVAHLTSLALRGADGRGWYTEAASALQSWADREGVSLDLLTGVLAGTSPQCTVEENVSRTRDTLALLAREGLGVSWQDLHTVKGVPRSVAVSTAKALRREDLTPSGPKVRAFARALRGDGDAFVLDTHIAKSLGIPHEVCDRAHVRKQADALYRETARRLGWPVAEVQAAVWCSIYTDVNGGAPAVRLLDLI
jgi:hypothetical protein